MNRIKYLIVFCIIVFLGAISIRSINNNLVRNVNNSISISPSVQKDYKEYEMDSNILIDDHEKPIILKKDDGKEVIRPYISAESYLVANLVTGERYLELNTKKRFPIASVSKLYSALVVHHLFDLEKKITITQSMLDSYGDAGGLVLDEKLTPDELLHALLLESSNDSAEALSQSFGKATTSLDFIEAMNDLANEIGMRNTSFKDSSGLSPENVSTADDLFVFSQYLYDSEKDILNISKIKEIEFATTTDRAYHHFKNINPFVYYKDFIGGKTGRTNFAKEAMVSLFNQKVLDKEYPIAVIILRSEFGQREIDTEKLLGMFLEKVAK